MDSYSYLEIFRRPLQKEELVGRVDATGKSPDEKVSQIQSLYECYPFKDYHIVLKGSSKELELIPAGPQFTVHSPQHASLDIGPWSVDKNL